MPFCVFALFSLDTNKPERNGNDQSKMNSFIVSSLEASLGWVSVSVIPNQEMRSNILSMSKKRFGDRMVHLITIIIIIIIFSNNNNNNNNNNDNNNNNI